MRGNEGTGSYDNTIDSLRFCHVPGHGGKFTKGNLEQIDKPVYVNKLYLKQQLYDLQMQESDVRKHVNVFNQFIMYLSKLDVKTG